MLYHFFILNNELANSLKAIAESESDTSVKFKIIETGGLSMRSVLQRSNPLEYQGCDSTDCLPCAPGRGEGGNGEVDVNTFSLMFTNQLNI